MSSAAQAVVSYSKERPISLVSNQFQLKVGSLAVVYQYAFSVTPMAFWDADLVQKVLRSQRRSMEKAIGSFTCSGQIMYTLQELTENVVFRVNYRGQQLSICIDADSGTQV